MRMNWGMVFIKCRVTNGSSSTCQDGETLHCYFLKTLPANNHLNDSLPNLELYISDTYDGK